MKSYTTNIINQIGMWDLLRRLWVKTNTHIKHITTKPLEVLELSKAYFKGDLRGGTSVTVVGYLSRYGLKKFESKFVCKERPAVK